jgi:hypothetical protein
MIARIWKGAVRRQDGDAYARYMRATGVADHEAAVFYPEDERFLVERDPTAAHYEVDTHTGPDVA